MPKEDHRKALARRWADRAVRIYAATALQLAGFASAAGALATLSEIVDDETVVEARRRLEVALDTVLSAREVPQSEPALMVTLAARAVLHVAQQPTPSSAELRRVVDALHALSEERAAARA